MNDNENMPRRFTEATMAERLTVWALLIIGGWTLALCIIIPVSKFLLKFFG